MHSWSRFVGFLVSGSIQWLKWNVKEAQTDCRLFQKLIKVHLYLIKFLLVQVFFSVCSCSLLQCCGSRCCRDFDGSNDCQSGGLANICVRGNDFGAFKTFPCDISNANQIVYNIVNPKQLQKQSWNLSVWRARTLESMVEKGFYVQVCEQQLKRILSAPPT